ncbi:MAG: CoA-binding protein [Ignavibacteriales bacterium]|nr:CoA-binding protein [Ignavibacteriales bacterium]
MEPVFRSWYERKMLATPQLVAETKLVENILHNIKTIAVVGISKDPHKDSHYVGRYLQQAGYRIIPVNPTASQILGEQCYANVASIPFKVDAVDIFRKPSEVLTTVEEAITIQPKVIWLQLGTGTHEDIIQKVWRVGGVLIQNRCMKIDHQFLIRNLPYKSNHTNHH